MKFFLIIFIFVIIVEANEKIIKNALVKKQINLNNANISPKKKRYLQELKILEEKAKLLEEDGFCSCNIE